MPVRGLNPGLRGAVFRRPDPRILLHWGSGTFANASNRYIWDANGKVLYGIFAGGVPAVATIEAERRYQSEGARTNRMPNDFNTWTIRGLVVRTSGQLDPDGGTGAYKFEGIANGAVSDTFRGAPGGASSVIIDPSVWLKKITSTGTFKILQPQNSTLYGDWSLDLSALGTSWERITKQHPAITELVPWVNDPGGSGGMHFQNMSASALDVVVWTAQQEEAQFASSWIPDATTRAADSMSFTASQVPAAIRSGKWSTEATLMHDNGDLATSQVMYAHWLDASNYLAIEEDGAGNVQVKLATTGGNLARTVTYSRDQTLTITVDFVAGSIIVEGATTGDGTTSGVVSDWPSSTLHVGSDSTPANHIFGRMSEPVAI